MAFTVDQILKATGAYECESISVAALWTLVGGAVDIDGGTLAGVEIDGNLTASGTPDVGTAAAPLGGVAASGLYSVGAESIPTGVDCVGTYYAAGSGYLYSGDPKAGAPAAADYKPLRIYGELIYLNTDVAGGGTVVVDGNIGPPGDVDLLELSADLLTLNGSLLVDDSGYIGCDSDTDLLQITSGALVVNGDIKLDPSATIGIDTDVDLITLVANEVRVTPGMRLSVAGGGGARDCYIDFRDADVSHGMTDYGDASTFLFLANTHASDGGGRIYGLSAANTTSGLTLDGASSAGSATIPVTILRGSKESGTGWGALGAGELAVELRAYATVGLQVWGDGEIQVPPGVLTVGVAAGSQAGHVNLLRQNDGTTNPSYLHFETEDGSDWYLFIEDDGTVKVHNAVPTANGDGSAVGDQTD